MARLDTLSRDDGLLFNEEEYSVNGEDLERVAVLFDSVRALQNLKDIDRPMSPGRRSSGDVRTTLYQNATNDQKAVVQQACRLRVFEENIQRAMSQLQESSRKLSAKNEGMGENGHGLDDGLDWIYGDHWKQCARSVMTKHHLFVPCWRAMAAHASIYHRELGDCLMIRLFFC